jgi:hypothetical protein
VSRRFQNANHGVLVALKVAEGGFCRLRRAAAKLPGITARHYSRTAGGQLPAIKKICLGAGILIEFYGQIQ